MFIITLSFVFMLMISAGLSLAILPFLALATLSRRAALRLSAANAALHAPHLEADACRG